MIGMTRVAVVSGSSYGIGEAISRKLLENGFKVYGISRTPPKFDNPKFVWLKADLMSESDIKNIPGQIEEKSIGLLVNNAGTAINEEVLEFKDGDFDQIFGLNFVAPIKLTIALFSKLTNGIVINISSLADRFPDGLYGSSKAALNNYFETIAAEYRDTKIIDALPSYVDTPLLRSLHKDQKDFDWSQTNQPEQIAEFVDFMLENSENIESGSRVVVVSSAQDDGEYDPEKLWLFVTDKKKLTRLK